MKLFSDNQFKKALPWGGLFAELCDAFAKGVSQPLRTAHIIPVPGGPDANFLAMPAWEEGGKLAVKILFTAPVFPRETCLRSTHRSWCSTP